jgi:aspartate aminotransferase
MVNEFRKRHDRVLERLNRLRGVTAIASQGTFYSFPDFSEAIERLDGVNDDVELASYFLDECGVALVPGSAFGNPGYLRLSYATDMDTLESALDRMERVLGTD